ncbi:MotB family protein [Mesorhizobium sp. 1B3]|uniref:MotB family protein n=1 Tax=Mesorhizobium sp. 1B3 TaxID=3243599 RepID=UPI003D992350
MSQLADERREIIIVKRRDDLEEDHHGGVWKIAYADFMTAMMCFFLVMWLINAANEETKLAVASYFNPIKLVDHDAAARGLDNPGEDKRPADSPSQSSDVDAQKSSKDGQATAGPSQVDNSAVSADDKNFSDENLFRDPYAVLAEIAGDTGDQQNISTKGDGGAAEAGPATGASGGDAYRDPFAPDFWSQEMMTLPSGGSTETSRETADAAAPDRPTTVPADETPAGMDELKQAFAAPPEEKPVQATETEPTVDDSNSSESKPAEAMSGGEADPAPQAEQTAERIGRELRAAFQSDDKMFGGISVVPTDKGVMISVTEQLNVGMFEIGSAVPRRELVLAMEKISKVLAAEKGNIVINGHTDGRPFASKSYDNWRLSTARAHSAYYMLVRAGLDERRVVEVAGFADRKLKVEDDPNAEANRRIEILVESGN